MTDFETAHPAAILEWAFGNIDRFVISTSFQAQGLVNVHIARQIVDRVPVLFLETGFHFPETLGFRDAIVEQWGLDLIVTEPGYGPERQRADGVNLPVTNPDECCRLNKVIPFERALQSFGGYATGLRRDQSPTRAGIGIVEQQTLESGHRIVKVNPLANWTRQQTWDYIRDNSIPTHPLYEAGYTSIGCQPCTKLGDPNDERSGRWAGTEKTECGIQFVGQTNK